MCDLIIIHSMSNKTLGMGNFFIYLWDRHLWTSWMTQDEAITGWQSLNWQCQAMQAWKLSFMLLSDDFLPLTRTHTQKIQGKSWTTILKLIMPYYCNKGISEISIRTILSKIMNLIFVLFLPLCFFPHFQTPVAPKICSVYLYHY